jgi:hypothetical protein
MIRGRFRPSPAMVVAFIALFIAIGGSSYAVTRLPAKSVGAKQLKRNAVRNVNIAKNAVTGAKVKNGSLTAADIKVASLAGVASAAAATNAAHAANAAGLDRVVYARQQAGVGPATGDPANPTATIGGASAACPPGTFVVGGGVGVDDNQNTSVVDSFPDPSGHAWTVRVDNSDPTAAHGFTVVAVCIPAVTAG